MFWCGNLYVVMVATKFFGVTSITIRSGCNHVLLGRSYLVVVVVANALCKKCMSTCSSPTPSLADPAIFPQVCQKNSKYKEEWFPLFECFLPDLFYVGIGFPSRALGTYFFIFVSFVIRLYIFI